MTRSLSGLSTAFAGGPDEAGADAATRERAASACHAAGLALTDRQFAMVCAAAPYVAAMTGRLYRERHWAEEPVPVFRLDA